MEEKTKVIEKKIIAKPFLKWAGGKKKLFRKIRRFLPCKFNSYFEPFLGGGTVFFAIRPQKAYLSDLNEDLVNAYRQIQTDVAGVLNILKRKKYNKKEYFRFRKYKPRSLRARAARLIYLNRTCWNGLYRVNKNGEFNVPFGRYKKPLIYNKENLEAVSDLLKRSSIETKDFGVVLSKAKKNDLIYLDPPYITGHENNGFIEYNAKLFSWKDQTRLKRMVEKLDKRGCFIVMSNADHPSIRKLYSKFDIHRITRKSLIAGDTSKRKRISELVITNFRRAGR